MPIAETYTTEPLSPYGVGKLAAERVCRQMLASVGVPLTVLRFFNTFGPGPKLHAVRRRHHDLHDAAAARRSAGDLR